MLKVDNVRVTGFEEAIRGMRNPMNSWKKSDSYAAVDCDLCGEIDRKGFCHPGEHDCSAFGFYHIGDNDIDLMQRLFRAGTEHRKYARMIIVYMDITAPLYWWKEFDTYKVGTVANSCSTMHKITEKPFTVDDFSHDRLNNNSIGMLEILVGALEANRLLYLANIDGNPREYWDQIIQLLPSSYNQRRTVMLNYEVCATIYKQRHNHKLPEWHTLCDAILELPYFRDITGY